MHVVGAARLGRSNFQISAFSFSAPGCSLNRTALFQVIFVSHVLAEPGWFSQATHGKCGNAGEMSFIAYTQA